MDSTKIRNEIVYLEIMSAEDAYRDAIKCVAEVLFDKIIIRNDAHGFADPG